MACEDELRTNLMAGVVRAAAIGSVQGADRGPSDYTVLCPGGAGIESINTFLDSLALGASSPLTQRSYAYDLLRWFRLLWMLDVPWDKATSSEVRVLVGALRNGRNPQRIRKKVASPLPGSVNKETGKPTLSEGYAATTINHNLSVISEFYKFHMHFGRGPLINPVPANPQRRKLLARGTGSAKPTFRRAPLRQRVSRKTPRVIPDHLWDRLFESMTCDRDRALMLFYWTSGARASEILGIRFCDVDWSSACVYVISKGTRLREAVPVSFEALRYLLRYLDQSGRRESADPIWLTRRGPRKPLNYSAFRRIFQRVNESHGMNWTLHDIRHTAATKMANDDALTLAEVQAVLRHSDIKTTGDYLGVRVEDLVERMQQHYERPRPERRMAASYDPEDVRVVFGD
jgi:integrase